MKLLDGAGSGVHAVGGVGGRSWAQCRQQIHGWRNGLGCPGEVGFLSATGFLNSDAPAPTQVNNST